MCRKHINFAWGKYKKGIAMHKLFNLIMAQVYWRWPHCLFCKILWNGTSYAWATKRLSHQPSEPAYYILDWRISCLAEACLMPRQNSFRDPSLNFEGPILKAQPFRGCDGFVLFVSSLQSSMLDLRNYFCSVSLNNLIFLLLTLKLHSYIKM